MFPAIKTALETTGKVLEKTSNVLVKPSNEAPHIAFLAIVTPLTIPLGELARLLQVHRGFTATFITMADESKNHAQAAFLESLPTGISLEAIPSLPLDDLLPNCSVEQRVAVMAARCVPFLVSILEKIMLTKRLGALVVDAAVASFTVDIAKTLGVPCYVFATSSMTAVSYCLHLSELDKTEPLSLPGCIQISGADFLQGSLDRASEAHKAMLRIFSKYKELDGIFVNSFVELEPGPYKALKEEESKGEQPPIYPIGPVISRDGWGDANAECLTWLNSQPKESVLYIAFGSGGTLSPEQTTELALGLEQCGQRFLWVVRWTTEKNGGGALFDLQIGKKDPLSCLPNGFLERTKGRGMVVPLWAPQVHILKHAAIGGFITNCGWSSVLESISFGVPMIAWPLFVEQNINAVLLSEGKGSVGVALRAKTGDDGIVRRDEVVNVVKELMGGEGGVRIRAKVKKVQASATKAAGEGGTSNEALAKWCESIAA